MYGYGAGHTPGIGQTCDARAWSSGRKSAHLGGVFQRSRVRHAAISGVAIQRRTAAATAINARAGGMKGSARMGKAAIGSGIAVASALGKAWGIILEWI
jgi:hypothetical protein